MNWLFRYILGLPAREQDINELKTNFPELIANPEMLRSLRDIYFISLSKLEVENFKKWLSKINYEQKTYETVKKCQFTNCPINNQETTCSDTPSGLLEFMTIGTGKKSPSGSFFDMVRKVYKDNIGIRKVILTDPYLIADVSADGIEGGFENIIKYLKIIITDQNSNFKLLISNTLKQQSNLEKFKDTVKRKFPNVQIDQYHLDYHIHDRLLITVDNKGIYKGMFGPSFNGLNSKSIVLFGELENPNTLDRIKRWFE